jgi:signal transduction histidine kinase
MRELPPVRAASPSASAPHAQAPRLAQRFGRAFWRRGVQTLAAGAVLAVVLVLALGYAPWPTLLRSLSYALACWLFIDSGIQLLRHQQRLRDRQPLPLVGLAGVIVLGTPAGYAAGYTLSNLVGGLPSGGLEALFDTGPRQWLLWGGLALLPAVAITAWFVSREQLASMRADAAAAERLATEAQLRLLQSQLEPHMLFNTLANLRVLIGLDAPRAQAMLDRLIAYLRATLAASRQDVHALADEFARLEDFLALMAVRMGPRLQAQLQLPPALRSLPVPPLLLQPLVENSIRHGLEPQVAGGRIVVSAERAGDRLRLVVRDTGVGLPDGFDALRSLARPGLGSPSLPSHPSSDPRAAPSRFGLEQVRLRLATLYGQAARFSLRPADDADGGTCAVIELPWPQSSAAFPAVTAAEGQPGAALAGAPCAAPSAAPIPAPAPAPAPPLASRPAQAAPRPQPDPTAEDRPCPLR